LAKCLNEFYQFGLTKPLTSFWQGAARPCVGDWNSEVECQKGHTAAKH